MGYLKPAMKGRVRGWRAACMDHHHSLLKNPRRDGLGRQCAGQGTDEEPVLKHLTAGTIYGLRSRLAGNDHIVDLAPDACHL